MIVSVYQPKLRHHWIRRIGHCWRVHFLPTWSGSIFSDGLFVQFPNGRPPFFGDFLVIRNQFRSGAASVGVKKACHLNGAFHSGASPLSVEVEKTLIKSEDST